MSKALTSDSLLRADACHLDPVDWAAARRLAHRMVDDAFDLHRTAADGPVWRPMPPELKERIRDEALPRTGSDAAAVYRSFLELVLPYPTGNLHPRFFGWVVGTGTPTGMMADMLASAMNPHLAGFDQSAVCVEDVVIRWLAEALGLPGDAGGLLESGGTMANLNGLATARQRKAGFDVRGEGLAAGSRLTVYGSEETHNWVVKACELLGLGRTGFRAAPVDERFRVDVAACRRMILADLEAGMRPICIIGNAGTTATGSVDDLVALRSLANEFDLWFHVDGALGALAALAPRARGAVAGQELADSLAFDLHKWGSLPFEAACVLVRDATAQRATFAQAPSYLRSLGRGVGSDTTHFSDRGVQLSRSFRALKVWMSLKEHGVDRLGAVIEKNVDQAHALAAAVAAAPDLRLLAPVGLNVVCLQFDPGGLAGEALDSVNEEIVLRVQESGVAVPSTVTLRGRLGIRVCIVNHRTRREDLDVTLDAIRTTGRRVMAEQAGALRLEAG